MPDELEERLRGHAQAFDSLLSLIPAKLYYGEDVSDQWQRKKQTPEQKRAAKKAKLDPDNWKSAKDVMDERQAELRKRKRDDDSDASDSPLVEPEKPKADQDLHNPKTKKRKLADPEASSTQVTNPATQETEEQRIQRKKEEKAAKKRRKQEKKAKKQEKIDRHKARKKEEKQQQKKDKPSKDGRAQKSKPLTEPTTTHQQSESGESEMDDQEMAEPINIDGASAFIEGVPLADDDASSSHSQEENPEVFSPLHDSGISSSSSIQPPTSEDQSLEQSQNPTSECHTEVATRTKTEGQQAPQLQNSSHDDDGEDPKLRLQAAISAFRAERKADTGPKSRTELLDQRRRQEERRRAEKKEQKRREREEAAQKQEEEIAKRFSPGGSGSLLGSPRSPIIEGDNNNFSFGRVAFADGSSLDPTASSAVEAHKKKGPSDPATAYKAAQAKQQRVSGYDAEKRATIQEKDMWNNARKRASGEKVKDDTSLLKKALKRHEGQKKKSEKEWTERKEGIQKGIDLKQKKRTENLAKRKDEKGQKGKKGKVKRPGFEGSFRGRTGGGKKNA